MRAVRDLAPLGLPDRHPNGVGLNHLSWMIQTAHEDGFDEAKTMRWLGYVQGYLVACGRATLDEMKQINKEASEI